MQRAFIWCINMRKFARLQVAARKDPWLVIYFHALTRTKQLQHSSGSQDFVCRGRDVHRLFFCRLMHDRPFDSHTQIVSNPWAQVAFLSLLGS